MNERENLLDHNENVCIQFDQVKRERNIHLIVNEIENMIWAVLVRSLPQPVNVGTPVRLVQTVKEIKRRENDQIKTQTIYLFQKRIFILY